MLETTQISTITVQELEKAQNIRLIDVFVIAPILIYAGASKSNLNDFVRIALVIIGVATLFYNAKNYNLNKKSE